MEFLAVGTYRPDVVPMVVGNKDGREIIDAESFPFQFHFYASETDSRINQDTGINMSAFFVEYAEKIAVSAAARGK